MLRAFCRAKLHRVTITDANLNYVGSLTVDLDLLDAAGLLPYEQVQVVNINTGARLETYLIPGARGGGTICLNGAAARLGAAGDLAIVIAYGWLTEQELTEFRPRLVQVDADNRVTRIEEPAVLSPELV
ncbi:MAG: aspartate 1-decarboxylase [Fimbriimonadaceae bacterium]|nr:aspartate 1-decarboxylase [Fimbriimonadaceae bacterium]